MLEDTITVMPDNFKGVEGDVIRIDMKKLRAEYAYCGLWYGRDGSAESAMTTSLYYSSGDKRPADAGEEIKENSFQQAGRFRIPSGHDSVWIAARVSDETYCKMQLSSFRKEFAYINYKVIRNRASGVEVLDSGVLRGGDAFFAKIGIEDMAGTVDYKDTVLYLVLIPDPPPDDWDAGASIGVQGLPVLVPSSRFEAGRHYSEWNGHNPLDGIGR